MAYKQWDESVLQSVRGDFYLEGTIPESFNLPLNQDGTEPVMTMQVTGETLGTTAQVLLGLQDYGIRLSHVATNIFREMREQHLVDQNTYPNLFDAVTNHTVQRIEEDRATAEEFAAYLKQERGWVNTNMSVEATNPETGEQHYVQFTLHTPGFAMVMTMLEEAVTRESIEALVLKHMPLDVEMYGEDIMIFNEPIGRTVGNKQQRTTVTPDYFS